MLKRLPSDKINIIKSALFFLSREIKKTSKNKLSDVTKQ